MGESSAVWNAGWCILSDYDSSICKVARDDTTFVITSAFIDSLPNACAACARRPSSLSSSSSSPPRLLVTSRYNTANSVMCFIRSFRRAFDEDPGSLSMTMAWERAPSRRIRSPRRTARCPRRKVESASTCACI